MRCDAAIVAPLVTERLIIRRLRASDAPALHAALSDPEVMRWLEPPFTPEQTARFIRDAGLCEPPRVFAVAQQGGGEAIGHAIFHPFDARVWEVGWVLRRNAWGQGFASELTRALIARARQAAVPALVIECRREQTASRRVAQRCGFQYWRREGGLDVYRLNLNAEEDAACATPIT